MDVQIRKDLLATVNDPPSERLGLTEAERQMIFRDIVRMEDRAYRDAKAAYPVPLSEDDRNYTETGESRQYDKKTEYALELMEKYKAELAESLGLTREQLRSIGNEGTKNWWELP